MKRGEPGAFEHSIEDIVGMIVSEASGRTVGVVFDHL